MGFEREGRGDWMSLGSDRASFEMRLARQVKARQGQLKRRWGVVCIGVWVYVYVWLVYVSVCLGGFGFLGRGATQYCVATVQGRTVQDVEYS